MTRRLLIIFLLFSCILNAQKKDDKSSKRNKYAPFFYFDYTYQKANSFSLSVGALKWFKRHTYIAFAPGATLIRADKTSYLSPTAIFEYCYQPKILKGAIAPLCRLGIIPMKISGQRDTYLYGDVGFRIISVTIYAGYNLPIDNKEINNISNFRIGIRLP
ncbi:MAG: hypothetical protein Q7W45_02120 [Bacteroidota bacterium]|nr:hypothetical protein [Bacteroidota bacterium]MDP3143839.1 hypothetical protein [Bacteroidota bacterium]